MAHDIPFQAHIDRIVAQYEQVAAENRQLRERIAALQAQLRPAEGLAQVPKSPSQSPSLMSKILRKTGKMRIQVDWIPLQYDFSDSVLCVTRANNILAFGTVDAKVVLLSADTFSMLSSYGGHRSPVNCIAHDPLTSFFASCSGDGTTHVWSHQSDDLDFSGRRAAALPTVTLKHHNGPVLCGCWLSNGGTLVTGSSDATVCFWDVAHSPDCTHFESLSSPVLCMDAARQSASLSFAAGLSSGEVRFFDGRLNGSVLSVAHAKGHVLGCHFVDDDYPHFVSAGTDKSVREWDLRSPSDAKRSFDVDHVPTKIAVAGKLVAVPSETGRTRLINLSNASIFPMGAMPFSYAVSSAAFLNDEGSRLLLASWDGSAAYAQLPP
jgi:WD40 repeat protein